MTNPKKQKTGPRKVGGKKAIFKDIRVGKGFLDNLKAGLAKVKAVSDATGIKPSALLAGSKYGKSTTGALGTAGLSALGLGKKKRAKPRKRKAQAGGSFWSDLGDGFISGLTLGAVRPGAAAHANLGFLPFGEKGYATKAGVTPSMIAGLTGNPAAAAGLAAVGQGKRGGRRMPAYGATAMPREQIGIVKF